ncbi:TPA_asm: protein 3 [Lolium perenne virus 1]|uniref:Protein 3 n=1 Tax=Lolium perenne virus 1 TaxID=2793730 RepID=A0A8D9PGX8_9RHAB|nr:protein 3 [Lolium perenne virus 1]DAF42363.1 TPA_asm: protein 3 [Lolium perenne virus 1]
MANHQCIIRTDIPSVFRSKSVLRELSWLVAEARCLIIGKATEIEISDMYHFLPTLDCINNSLTREFQSCSRCSGGSILPGYYLGKNDLIDLLLVLKASKEEVLDIEPFINEDIIICTDCTLCAIIHRSPKRLLSSVLMQIYDISINGLWPYNPVVLRESIW